MTHNSKKLILFIIIAIAIAGFAIGYTIWNKPHKDVKDAKAIPVEAISLYNLYTADSEKAKQLYENKIVLVKGEIKQVSINQQNQQVILLKTATEGGAVNCTMEENFNAAKPGNTISVKGICSGYISGDTDMGLPGDVFMVRCYSVNN
jgi:hypothetical protein